MDVRTVVAKVAGQAAASVVPFSGVAVEAVVSDLLKIQDEQLTILRKLEGNVQRLADAPWQSAIMHLRDAAIPGRHPEQARRSLQLAADKLHDAIPLQQAESPSRADARLLLAVVFAVLGDNPASRHHAVIAYREARTAAWWMLNTEGKLPHDARLSRLATISAWYDDAEWVAALLGDPEAPSVEPGNELVPQDQIPRSPGQPRLQPHSVEARVRWRDGAPLDFLYVAYAQQVRHLTGRLSVHQFIGHSLEQVLDGEPEPLPSPFEWQIMDEQRMGYFTGMEE